MKLIPQIYAACLALMILYACNARQHVLTSPSRTGTPQAAVTDAPLGLQPRSVLQQPPNRQWFDSIYRAYTPDRVALELIRRRWRNEKVEIFLGAWCGDSRREVPRMLKILDSSGIPAANIRLVLLHNRYPLYKASPGREEKGKFIFRVPTFIVYSDKELGRIVESPVASLEKDLLAILSGDAYTPRYRAGAYLQPLILQDDWPAQTRPEDLAPALQPLAGSVAELNSLGYTLLSAGQTAKASMVLRLNALLYPQEPSPWNLLADLYVKNGEKDKALECYGKALEIAPENALAKQMLDSLRLK